jgi:branched-chain amino acid transport system permease protein
MIQLDPILLWILYLIALLAMYIIAVTALNFQYGYAGLPNFGLVFSIASGAYVTGALTGRIAMWYYGIGSGLDYINDNTLITTMLNQKFAQDPIGGLLIFVLTIIIAMIISAGLGFIASFPAIRLREDYLLMVLIAMGEATRIIGVNYTPLVGGTLWVNVPNLFAWLGTDSMYIYPLIMIGIAILVFLLMQTIVTTPFGRLIRAIRDEETAAQFLGKDTIKVKMIVMMVGSALASIAGVLYATYTQSVIAAAFTRVDWTFWPWLMLLIGGKGNNAGGTVGAISIIFIREFIIFYKHDLEQFIPFSVIWLEQILLGLALILVVMFKPEGFIPEKPTHIKRP